MCFTCGRHFRAQIGLQKPWDSQNVINCVKREAMTIIGVDRRTGHYIGMCAHLVNELLFQEI